MDSPASSGERALLSQQIPRTLVINLNAPELNALAAALVSSGCLVGFVRPYVNKGRKWEQVLASAPLAGPFYRSTFGRREVASPALSALTDEAGVWADLCSALVTRLPLVSPQARHRWANRLRMRLRDGVSQRGARRTQQAEVECVVAYEGFALPAWHSARSLDRPCAAVLNYPVAHHRWRKAVRDEELDLEPAFAPTWPGFDDWDAHHEDRLDEEIALADRVLVGSNYAADTFVRAGVERARMAVVPYGVDLELFAPSAKPPTRRPFQVIFTGQLTQRKGLSYLLRAYRLFRRQDTRLLLVGSTVGSAAPLQAFADDFEHVDHQTRPALVAHYQASHVFVLPTLIEGMPLVVLEAMACGVPVIVTANGPSDIVRHGIDGFIVPQRDPQAIAERLEQLYGDEDLRQQMGLAARQRAQAFGWDTFAHGAQAALTGALQACSARLNRQAAARA